TPHATKRPLIDLQSILTLSLAGTEELKRQCILINSVAAIRCSSQAPSIRARTQSAFGRQRHRRRLGHGSRIRLQSQLRLDLPAASVGRADRAGVAEKLALVKSRNRYKEKRRN